MARVDCDVLIMGNGIVGNLAAAWFTRRMPALRVAVVGPAARSLPIVGESLVEFSTQLLQEVGLGRHLVEKQLPKYGLTFYYKLDPATPADPRYVVDAVPTNPPLPSFLVNRFTLDDALQQLNRDRGVEQVDGKVVRVELGSDAHHGITVRRGDGTVGTHTTRWVIDATGRRRLLARQLQLGDGVPHQRSAFWFRLADFDASILDRIDAVASDARRPDAYYATHHFFGRGNWIWLIPVRVASGRRMMSVGLTCRPDLFPEPVTSIPEFLDRVAGEHPILGDLVRSGSVVDTNLYRNYMYRTRRRYSSRGWFLIGDAADTVDPLYSTGLALATMAIQQGVRLFCVECPTHSELYLRVRFGRGQLAADISSRGFRAPPGLITTPAHSGLGLRRPPGHLRRLGTVSWGWPQRRRVSRGVHSARGR